MKAMVAERTGSVNLTTVAGCAYDFCMQPGRGKLCHYARPTSVFGKASVVATLAVARSLAHFNHFFAIADNGTLYTSNAQETPTKVGYILRKALAQGGDT